VIILTHPKQEENSTGYSEHIYDIKYNVDKSKYDNMDDTVEILHTHWKIAPILNEQSLTTNIFFSIC
jgi:hypothetical protein